MRRQLTQIGPIVTVALAAGIAACAPERLPGEGASTSFAEALTSGEELQAEAAGRDIVLARVAGHVITLEEFDLRLASQSESAQLIYDRTEWRPSFFEILVLQEMIARDAEAAGLAGSAFERVMVDDALLGWWAEQQWPDALTTSSFDEAEIAAMHATLAPALTVPERRSARMLVVDSEARAREVSELFATQIAAGVPATVIFRWVSDVEIEERGDDAAWHVPLFVRPEVGEGETDEVLDALFELEERGDIAGPFRTGRGWEFVQLLSEAPALDPSPEVLDTWLREERLREEQIAIEHAALVALRDASAVDIDDAAVAALTEARRGGGPAEPAPRRFGEQGLRGIDALVFGDASLADFDATAYDTRRDLVAPALPEEGSADGSGDTPGPESP